MLLDLTSSMLEKLAGEFREAGPEDKEQFIRSSVALLELFTEALKTSLRR